MNIEHTDICKRRVKWSTSNNVMAPEADPNPYFDRNMYNRALLSCDIDIVCFHLTYTLNKEAVYSSETFIHAYQTTWCHSIKISALINIYSIAPKGPVAMLTCHYEGTKLFDGSATIVVSGRWRLSHCFV